MNCWIVNWSLTKIQFQSDEGQSRCRNRRAICRYQRRIQKTPGSINKFGRWPLPLTIHKFNNSTIGYSLFSRLIWNTPLGKSFPAPLKWNPIMIISGRNDITERCQALSLSYCSVYYPQSAWHLALVDNQSSLARQPENLYSPLT